MQPGTFNINGWTFFGLSACLALAACGDNAVTTATDSASSSASSSETATGTHSTTQRTAVPLTRPSRLLGSGILAGIFQPRDAQQGRCNSV